MAEQLKREVFGTTKDGETVYRVEIKGGGLTAKIMTWGAVIQDLRLDGHEAPLLLGFDNFADYPAYSSYFGATPGRCANRIGGGKFTLDSREVLATNGLILPEMKHIFVELFAGRGLEPIPTPAEFAARRAEAAK